jgi:hemerythrin-like domain-containing protein
VPVQLGTPGQPGFDRPIDLMMDCHRRIEHFLGVLGKVVEARRGGPLDDEHRRAILAALEYFRVAAPRHTEDEEHSLFPRMRGSSDPAVREALERIEALEADHRRAEEGHARVDELGRAWIAEDGLAPERLAELSRLLDELRESYARHIEVEDTLVFPLAERCLNAAELSEVGSEMRRRRGR